MPKALGSPFPALKEKIMVTGWHDFYLPYEAMEIGVLVYGTYNLKR
jgi:hypothetical protein